MEETQETKPVLSETSAALTQALQQYAEELEALHNSFRQIMYMLSLLHKKGRSEIEAFIKEHGVDHKDENNAVTFNLRLDKRAEFQKLDRELNSVVSAQRLIPRNFIVALVCAYDSFLGKLLRFILESKPEILDASERILTFSELVKFADINAAREYLIEKEIESVLRKSHTDQFAWLEKKLGTPFNKGLKSWPLFVELTERRNLFVHCDGVVSTQYLSVCSENKCNVDPSIKLGAKLGVPREYFEDTYKTLYEIGVKLAHVIWRKLNKKELEQIDENLIYVTYSLIEKQDFEIALRILEFFTQNNIEHFDDNNKRVLTINLAQAHKWGQNNEKCNEILNSTDWSASEDRFKLCVSVLKDDFVTAYKYIRRLVHDETFHKIYYKEWPIFQKLREKAEFISVYEECYKEPFSITQKMSAKSKDNDDSASGQNSNDASTVEETLSEGYS